MSDTPTEAPPPSQSRTDRMREAIKRKIADSSVPVEIRVIDHFVEQETDRRAKLIIDGVMRLADAETALAKFKPDSMVFDDDGKMIQQGWSADNKSRREKAQKVVAKINEGLTLALAGADFKKLEEALKGNAA